MFQNFMCNIYKFVIIFINGYLVNQISLYFTYEVVLSPIFWGRYHHVIYVGWLGLALYLEISRWAIGDCLEAHTKGCPELLQYNLFPDGLIGSLLVVQRSVDESEHMTVAQII